MGMHGRQCELLAAPPARSLRPSNLDYLALRLLTSLGQANLPEPGQQRLEIVQQRWISVPADPPQLQPLRQRPTAGLEHRVQDGGRQVLRDVAPVWHLATQASELSMLS